MQGITVCGAFKLVIEELIKAEEELQVLPWLMAAALELPGPSLAWSHFPTREQGQGDAA